jgi:NADH-quinone oxidoreductase subunit H
MTFFNDLLSGISGFIGHMLGIVLPFWLVQIILALVGIGVIVTFIAVLVMTQVWAERKMIARIQDRVGPNRVGPFGLAQTVADVVKLLGKEDTIPGGADRLVFVLAPLVVLVPSLMIYAVLPFNWDAVVTQLDVGILYVLALAALPTLGILMAAWGSYNKYSLLGGMRGAAQLISYEVPEVLSVLPSVMLAGTLSLWGIAAAQTGGWFILAPVVGPLAFVAFFISGLAEINRSPFDLPEAESEIIAGFHMEYSGMRFALFFLAEYANATTVSAIAATLFFGGWNGWILPGFVWFLIKTYLLFLVMVWARGTLPRLRYDQLMAFAWKVLLPLTLVNIVLAAVVKELGLMNLPWPILLAINVPVVVVIYWAYNRFYLTTQRRVAPPLLESALSAARS